MSAEKKTKLGAILLLNVAFLSASTILSTPQTPFMGVSHAQQAEQPVEEVEQKDPNEVLATIGRKKIKREDLEWISKFMGQQFAGVPAAQREQALLNSYIDFHLLAEKARDERLHKSDEFKGQMELLQTRSLHDEYFRVEYAEKIDPAEIQARYDKEVEPLKGKEEIRARHILVETTEAAQEIIKLLEEGGDFAELAKEKSTGPSGANGGDLGFFGKGNMVPAFEEASFALQAGEFTKEPVQTQFGFHIIKLEERREVPVPALEQVEPQIRQSILQEKYVELVKNLREEMKVEIVTK